MAEIRPEFSVSEMMITECFDHCARGFAICKEETSCLDDSQGVVSQT